MSRLFLAALVAGCAMLGGAGSTAQAAQTAPLMQGTAAQAGVLANVQPVYWTRNRFGRRVWVENRHERRRGWVDRRGHWHR